MALKRRESELFREELITAGYFVQNGTKNSTPLVAVELIGARDADVSAGVPANASG